MQNKLIIFLSLIVSLIFVLSCDSGPSIEIAKNGKSSYTIILAENASLSEHYSAEELRHFIKLATDAELPVTDDMEQLPKGAGRIFIGFGKTSQTLIDQANPIDIDSLGDEGFVIRTLEGFKKHPDIIIAGGRLRGTMYGVYTFLEHFGFRWYTQKVTRYPEGKILKAGAFDLKIIPEFMSRDTSIKEARDADWAARNRLNAAHADLDEHRGGKVGVLGVHTLDRLIPPALYETHPEYFPLIGGKRVTGLVQRCMSNPDIVDIAAKNLAEWMDSEPDHHIFSVSANDVGMLCECDECRRITEEEGATAGLFLRFVNSVAEKIEKTHPDNYVSTLAYAITEKAPKITKPRHNVIIRLCPFFICVGHPFTECTSDASRKFYTTLQDWGKISENIFIWHYATNFDAYLLPFPNFREFTRDIKTYRDNRVSGMFLQGAGNTGSSNGELRAWVAAQLMWNPDRDPESLINEWMHAIYADAFEPMRKIFDHIHDRIENPDRHLGIHDRITAEDWPPDDLAYLDSLYLHAESLVSNNDEAFYYIRKNRMSVRYLQLLFNSGELVVNGDIYTPSGNTVTRQDYEQFRKDMIELDVDGLREEPFDCVYEDLLGEKLRNHNIVQLENEDLVLKIVPDLGGRIVSIILKASGTDILGKTDPLNYFYPAYGGYEESTTMTWGRTGFANNYHVEINGLTATLTAEEGKSARSKGLIFKRTITLPKKGTNIQFESSITNISKTTQYARLISHMEINSNPVESKMGFRDAKGKNREEQAGNFYRNGENKPQGYWYVTNTADGWTMENRFKSGDIEGCHLICYNNTKTIEMEVLGFEKNLSPGEKITRKHTWTIK
ncbi:MAG: DUF4838 domain-containing protein [Candidatus Latescibacteria bacterium]|nr:DUF4838 domain-containing protein [Candidatus Latescibacterota bacterium]